MDFIWWIVVLFVVIGFLNFLLVLVLDGGYLMFYVYEVVVGCCLLDWVLDILLVFGMVVVLLLMIFGLINDFFCL